MAKFMIELTPDQIKRITESAVSELQKAYDSAALNLQKQLEKDKKELEGKFKTVVVDEAIVNPKPTPTGATRHTWNDSEIEQVISLYKQGKRAKGIGAALSINPGAVNAKITALAKQGKLK